MKNSVVGIHAVEAAINQSAERLLFLYLQENKNDQKIKQIISLAERKKIPIKIISKQKLDQLFPDVQHQGIAAEYSREILTTEDDLENLLSKTSSPFLLILDGVQDPHNLGACLRTANAAGVDAVIIPKDKSVGLTPTVRKVASGAAETTPLIQVTNLARTLRKLQEHGVWLYGMAEEAKKTLYEINCRGSIGIILGAEDIGLRRLTRDHCDDLLSLPMHGTVSSLNVSVATGICLYEAVRQRKTVGA